MTTYTIKDTHTDATVTAREDDSIADLIRGWYPEAPQEVLDVIDELDCRPDQTSSIWDDRLHYLGVEIIENDDPDED